MRRCRRCGFTTARSARRSAMRGGRITNAVLVMHGSSGDAGQVLTPLVHRAAARRRDGPLDARKYFLIFPDSSATDVRPNPATDCARRFPKYGYTDMVRLAAPTDYRRARHRAAETRHGDLDGRHARLDVGHPLSRRDGGPRPDCGDADGRAGTQPAVAADPRAGDPERSRVEGAGPTRSRPQGFLSIMPMFDMLVQSPARLGESSRMTYADADDASRRRASRRRSRKTMPTTSSIDSRPRSTSTSEPDLERIRAPLMAILFADDELNPLEPGRRWSA